ncbi:mannose-6-phosphate isomerase, class I [Gemella haemolysans]|uniref:mannose-6-phosphate isomerase, class I n=1 Tax=Gemella haemolysans TaxID=1379 RepID=UPI00195E23AA|nr:mannose-6-phosphate isomerase, class I [Gemella haemolysans]VTX53523.1 putative mannose-6-phosphate isomerase GmuF [Gemella haemolysans]
MGKIIFLEPVFCERIWGGRNLESFNFSIPQGNIGEAWVIAAHDNGSSKIINGQLAGLTLKEAYEKQPTLFTEKTYDKFPLLIKILDASDNLSVQVHPEDDYARVNENGELGKTECWYVLDAKEGAKLVYGHTAKTKEEFNSKIDAEQWNELFIEESVKAGDFFYIPAGTLHAIGEGILIYEVQQNSDTTYRVYDYDRVDKEGNARELHIEKTKDVTKVPFEKVQLEQEVYEVGNIKVTQLAEERYFGVYKIEVSGEAELTKNDTGNLFTVLEGQGRIKVEDTVYDIKKGDSFILTTQCSDCLLDGDMLLIGSYDR